MPRGTASRFKARYAVQLTVPRRGGWRAWGAVRADFERALAGAPDPAVISAEIASELRRGASYVRVSVAFTVVTTDVAGALAIAWDAFRSAARDDPAGWEVAAAVAQVQPEPPLATALNTGCGVPVRARVTERPPGRPRGVADAGAGCDWKRAAQGIVTGCLLRCLAVSRSAARSGMH